MILCNSHIGKGFFVTSIFHSELAMLLCTRVVASGVRVLSGISSRKW